MGPHSNNEYMIMPANDRPEIDAKLKSWIDTSIAEAVRELSGQGLMTGIMIEAKPAWVLPERILIGKLRDPGARSDFYWFICGEVPTDCLPSSVAPSPRDVARHFSLKWQLDAARQESEGSELEERAELLYALSDDDRLWFDAG
jgi:hypothetical protein